MKKPEFVASELEVIRFTESDIIMTSPASCSTLYEHGDGDPTLCTNDLEWETD